MQWNTRYAIYLIFNEPNYYVSSNRSYEINKELNTFQRYWRSPYRMSKSFHSVFFLLAPFFYNYDIHLLSKTCILNSKKV